MSTPIGETLRRAREARGLSVSDAAAETCIRERYLRALEEEQFAAVGEGVYAKGFLRSYAKALGVDPGPLLDTYRTQHEQPPPDEAALTGQVLQGEERPLPRAVRLTAAAGAIVFVFALLAAVGLQNETPNAATPSEARTPPEESEILAEAPHTPLPAEEAGAEPEQDDDVEPEAPSTPEPDPAPAAVDGIQVHMEIDGGESWVRVVVDGDVAFEGIKPEGTTATFSGDEEVFLRIGNAGAVHLTVNGEEQGTAGGSGEVVEHSYRIEDRTSA